ncbi:hypothetical protein [Romboutsia sp. 1001713B170207_170306_H8]|uniref:hypothetical protein n=1 Tax=Romboutsia sp. 1001713B170207_170306_H8 TaxID=2787112 RepID=UPI000822DE0D|nr:hypothetical protein [Romboutsia sp. 1001713B170207_170306_H8]SCH03853.1 Uncharacterised protein [uncultured Clostridium sp.]
MNKLLKTIFLSTTILFNTACTISDSNISGIDDLDKTKIAKFSSESSNLITIPIQIDFDDPSKIVEVKCSENDSIEEKVNLVLDTISKECFNSLPIKGEIVGNSVVEIELNEYDEESKKISWKRDYLNEYTKDYTINIIVQNLIQDTLKTETYNIKDVRVYYDDRLITLN